MEFSIEKFLRKFPTEFRGLSFLRTFDGKIPRKFADGFPRIVVSDGFARIDFFRRPSEDCMFPKEFRQYFISQEFGSVLFNTNFF